MRIALLTASERPIPATMGGATQTMMTHLIDVNEERGQNEFVVFSYYESKAFEKSKDYKFTKFFYYHPKRFFDYFNSLFWRICRRISNNKIYVRSNFARWCSYIIEKEDIDVVILEGQDADVQYMRERYSGTLILHMHIDFLNDNYKNADRIIDCCDGLFAISNYCKKKMVTVKPSAENKIIVIKNTIDTDLFKRDGNELKAQEIRSKIGIQPHQKLICFCGRITPEKGVIELIQAISRLNNPNIKLIIIGSSAYAGSRKNKFIKHLEKIAHNHIGGVYFTGYISQEDLPKYFTACDIVVVPSICEEAAGNVIIEALSCEIPVIASTQGGIPEYADTSSSCLVKYDEFFVESLSKQINKLITDEKAYYSLRKHAREIAQLYNKYNYYDNFINAINSIIKK